MVITTSPNVSNFDFSACLDISLTTPVATATDISTYISGGQSNIIGINFKIVDPFNLTFHQSVYPPDIDLTPGLTSITPVPLPYFNGKVRWGTYKIFATLIDQDGTQYEWTGDGGITYKSITICQPNTLNGATGNYGGLALIADFNCDTAEVIVADSTSYSYNGLTSVVTDATIVFSYPPDNTGFILVKTSDFLPFSLPITIAGTYSINAKVVQTYNPSSTTCIKAAYVLTVSELVNCGTTLCAILCDYEKLVAEVKGCDVGKYTPDIAKKQKQLLLIDALLIQVLSFKNCGKKFGDILEEIKKIGNFTCDCNCQPQGITPVPLFINKTIVKGNMCGDINLTLTPFEGNVKIDASDVSYNVVPSNASEDYLTVTPETGVCSKKFTIGIDPDELIAAADQNLEYTTMVAAAGWTISGRLEYAKDAFGNVSVRGILAGTSAAGTNVLTVALPSGFRPSANESFATWFSPASTQASIVQLTVLTTGVITAYFTGINANIGIGMNLQFNVN